MRISIFSVLDRKAELFARPFFEATQGTAIRVFSDAVNEGDHAFSKHPEDYSLYHIGDFDESTGVIDPYVEPVPLGLAVTFLLSED